MKQAAYRKFLSRGGAKNPGSKVGLAWHHCTMHQSTRAPLHQSTMH